MLGLRQLVEPTAHRASYILGLVHVRLAHRSDPLRHSLDTGKS
jgi:hypothetical protein